MIPLVPQSAFVIPDLRENIVNSVTMATSQTTKVDVCAMSSNAAKSVSVVRMRGEERVWELIVAIGRFSKLVNPTRYVGQTNNQQAARSAIWDAWTENTKPVKSDRASVVTATAFLEGVQRVMDGRNTSACLQSAVQYGSIAQ